MSTWNVSVPLALVLGLAFLALGMALGWMGARARSQERANSALQALARTEGERDLLRAELDQAEQSLGHDERTAAELAPLRASLERVERQVQVLERDRLEQFGQVGEHLVQVAAQTRALQEQTASLSGALSASATRGTWGEVQLRRVLEHAGMLAHCDFDEQVSATTRHDARVRPDVVVHLPGEASVVIDAKAPMSSFLKAQADELPSDEAQLLLSQHAKALRAHVDSLAAKDYWSAFEHSPELVLCFVPSDAVLAAALRADPSLYHDAQLAKVVLVSPASLLAVLRAMALAWQRDSLTQNAHELLAIGAELHQRLGTLGRHVVDMGSALRRSVESYNRFVGTMESRVLVTSRKLHELGLVEDIPKPVPGVEVTPRPLTAAELLQEEFDVALAPDQQPDGEDPLDWENSFNPARETDHSRRAGRAEGA